MPTWLEITIAAVIGMIVVVRFVSINPPDDFE